MSFLLRPSHISSTSGFEFRECLGASESPLTDISHERGPASTIGECDIRPSQYRPVSKEGGTCGTTRMRAE